MERSALISRLYWRHTLPVSNLYCWFSLHSCLSPSQHCCFWCSCSFQWRLDRSCRGDTRDISTAGLNARKTVEQQNTRLFTASWNNELILTYPNNCLIISQRNFMQRMCSLWDDVFYVCLIYYWGLTVTKKRNYYTTSFNNGLLLFVPPDQ